MFELNKFLSRIEILGDLVDDKADNLVSVFMILIVEPLV
jgi:hypothetical protein